MIDRKKVIKAIDVCLGHGHCDDCGYRIKGGYSTMDCRRPMMRDALALLKEQETVKPKQIIRKQCKKEHEDGSIDYFAEWYCPHCDSLLVVGFDNKWIQFCPRCGKPITWEER